MRTVECWLVNCRILCYLQVSARDKVEDFRTKFLSNFFAALAEKLTDAEVDELFEDCLDEENDDGEIVYDRN